MNNTKSCLELRSDVRRGAALAVAMATLLASTGIAHAIQFEYGDLQGSIDTTISGGLQFRASDRDRRFIGANPAAPGQDKPVSGYFVRPNADDGNLNFDPGTLTAATFRATHETSLKLDNFGFFNRVTYFYDPINSDRSTGQFRDLSPQLRHRIGYDFRVLDLFAYGSFEPFDKPLDIRFGNQVINWGESTFIQFGINSNAPVDVAALRTPGSELRQALLPIPAVDVKFGVTDSVSVEGYYQAYWEPTRLDPVGSYFATNDVLLPGGRYAGLDFIAPDVNNPAARILGVTRTDPITGLPASQSVLGSQLPRGNDIRPGDQGQYGVALRYRAEFLGDAEFGFYYQNYHSRLPFPVYQTPSALSLAQAAASVGAAGVPALLASTPYYALARIRAAYPDNINQFAASVNFVGPLGIALQGEYSYRSNQPVTLGTADLTLATAYPIINQLAGLSPTFAALAAGIRNNATVQAAGGPPGYNSLLNAYKRLPISQWQMTATKLFKDIPGTGIASWSVVGEMGFTYVHDFPSNAAVLAAPFTTDSVSGNPFNPGNLASPLNGNAGRLYGGDGLADDLSAGYVIQAAFNIPNAFGPIDATPRLAFSHNFYGTSPSGANSFIQGAAAVTMGIDFSYLRNLNWGVQYTNFFNFGKGSFNALTDRDFVSAFVTYSF